MSHKTPTALLTDAMQELQKTVQTLTELLREDMQKDYARAIQDSVLDDDTSSDIL